MQSHIEGLLTDQGSSSRMLSSNSIHWLK